MPTPEEFDAATITVPETIETDLGQQPTAPGLAPPPVPVGWPKTLVSGAIGFPFAILTDRRGDHWALKPAEQDALADLAKQALDLWLPVAQENEKMMALVVFAGAFGVAIETRRRKDKQLAKDRPASSTESIGTEPSAVSLGSKGSAVAEKVPSSPAKSGLSTEPQFSIP